LQDAPSIRGHLTSPGAFESPVQRAFQARKSPLYQQDGAFFNKSFKKPRQLLLSEKT
jgi:hypothetical protein